MTSWYDLYLLKVACVPYLGLPSLGKHDMYILMCFEPLVNLQFTVIVTAGLDAAESTAPLPSISTAVLHSYCAWLSAETTDGTIYVLAEVSWTAVASPTL